MQRVFWAMICSLIMTFSVKSFALAQDVTESNLAEGVALYTQAVELLTEASEKNLSAADRILWRVYLENDLISVDADKFDIHLRRAAKGGDTKAQELVERLLKQAEKETNSVKPEKMNLHNYNFPQPNLENTPVIRGLKSGVNLRIRNEGAEKVNRLLSSWRKKDGEERRKVINFYKKHNEPVPEEVVEQLDLLSSLRQQRALFLASDRYISAQYTSAFDLSIMDENEQTLKANIKFLTDGIRQKN